MQQIHFQFFSFLENFGYTYDLDKNVAFEVNYIKNEPINIENSIINVSTEKDLNETLDKLEKVEYSEENRTDSALPDIQIR